MRIDIEKIKDNIIAKDIYDVKEINEITGIPASTIRQWIYTGKIQKIKVGGRVYITGKDILAMFNFNN